MIIARFQFTQESAHLYSEEGSVVVEQILDTIEDVIEFCDEFGQDIVDVNCIVNGQVVSLSDVPAE